MVQDYFDIESTNGLRVPSLARLLGFLGFFENLEFFGRYWAGKNRLLIWNWSCNVKQTLLAYSFGRALSFAMSGWMMTACPMTSEVASK